MGKPDFERALKRMETVIANWFVDDFMMLGTWSLLEKKANPHVTTMGLDTRCSPAILHYNPNFINALNNETLEMVMAAEGLKIMLRHATTRMKNPRDVSSLASSITVDQLILKGQQVQFPDITPMPSQYGLEDDKFFEMYYRQLNENLDDTRSKMEKQFGKSASEKEKEELEQEQRQKNKGKKKDSKDKSEEEGDAEEGEGQEAESGEESESSNGSKKKKSGKGKSSESGDGEPSEESGNGESGESGEFGEGDSEENYPEFKDERDAMKNHNDPRNDNNKYWGENDGLDAEVENMVEEFRGSAQKWGKHSGNAMSQIVAANTPKISYKEVIKRFATSVTTTKQIASRMKYNRRFGLDAPGRRRINTTKVLFALDVSGSMSDEDIAEGFAVVNACCKHAEVHWMTFATEVHDLATKLKKAQQMFKVNGRGGTDPAPVLKYAAVS